MTDNETRTVTGKIEKTNIKEGAKDGRAWKKSGCIVCGQWYNLFGELGFKEGDNVEIQYTKGNFGNDIKSITASTNKESKTELPLERADIKVEELSLNLSRFQARRDAINAAVKMHAEDGLVSIDKFFATAETVETWLMRSHKPKVAEKQEPKEPEAVAEAAAEDKKKEIPVNESEKPIIVETGKDTLINFVLSTPKGLTLEQAEGYFVTGQETKDKIVAAALATKKIKASEGKLIKA